MWSCRAVSRHSSTGYSSWAGPTAGTCKSTLAGLATSGPIAARRNWSRWGLMSSLRLQAGVWRRCRQGITRSVPIVFANVVDPVGAGFVASLARPGGNTTGFSAFEYSLSGKWLELLKEIAPSVARVAVLRDPALAAGIGQFAAIQALAPASLGGELTPIDVRDAGEIERAMAAFARERNGGLIVTGSQSQLAHRDLIISLATRYCLPNVHAYRYYPAAGGSRLLWA
jgi:ABC transporter substrate binding protein